MSDWFISTLLITLFGIVVVLAHEHGIIKSCREDGKAIDSLILADMECKIIERKD